jgi:hypothetical protein
MMTWRNMKRCVFLKVQKSAIHIPKYTRVYRVITMGIDIYASVFSPRWDMDQDYEYCYKGIVPEGIEELTQQYQTKEFPSSHRIWSSWRDGMIDIPISGTPHTAQERLDSMLLDINYFWMQISTPESANETATIMEKYYGHDSELQEMARWLRYWASHNASFHSK